jgi:hypothetical protein
MADADTGNHHKSQNEGSEALFGRAMVPESQLDQHEYNSSHFAKP